MMLESDIVGPFGPARKISSLAVTDILTAYRNKCGADVSASFDSLSMIDLYECLATGYRFWRPETIAADEYTYQLLSQAWPDYYRNVRWEYRFVRAALRKTDRVSEIGCGRGYFLRSIESRVREAIGIEFNLDAIANKVTKFPIHQDSVEEFATSAFASMDVVCSFQVLEHVIDPCSFIKACVDCLRPGGRLFVSTPNRESAMLKNREDAFDLPPHHMGHFSAEVYSAIARALGLELVKVRIEPKRSWAADTISLATKNSFAYRKIKALTTKMLNFTYWLLGEPGNNILVEFRKPS